MRQTMKKYIFFAIFGLISLHCQTPYAQTVAEDILADEELMKTITPEQLEQYLANGANINTQGSNMIARVMGKDIKFIRSVINGYSGENKETKNLGNSGISPLMYALKGRNFGIIKTLLEKGADVNSHDSLGNTALMYACRFNADEHIIRMLIKFGGNVNARDDEWKSVLMYASQNDNVEILRTLVQAGANVNAKMEDGTTALIIAAQTNPNPEIVKFLLDSGADIEARVMLTAVQSINSVTNKIRKKQKAIKATTNINMQEVANTALSIFAAQNGVYVDADSNVASGVLNEVEQIYNNVDGKTVLMAACDNKNPAIVALLLSYNVNVNAVGPFGMTALMYACDSKTSSDVNAIKTLLKHGAKTKFVNEYGETAMDYLKNNGIKKENPEYWDVFELYNQVAQSEMEQIAALSELDAEGLDEF